MPIIINPGTESRNDATVENAVAVADHIVREDLDQRCSHERNPESDLDGWFGFVFRGPAGSVEVDIPGDDPETVILGRALVSRRLYVDGSSWLYSYAVRFIRLAILGEPGS